MIRSHFGLQRNPFDTENLALLAHQQEVFDILRVHAQQGGLCLVVTCRSAVVGSAVFVPN